MTKRTSIAGRIEAFVKRLDGAGVCDDCVTDRLDLSSVAQATIVTHAAGGTAGFERLKAPCGLCAETKLVIRYKM